MMTSEALKIVLDLARQNIVDERDMPDEAMEQEEACSIIELHLMELDGALQDNGPNQEGE